MKKYSSDCKLRRIKAVNRNRNEPSFTTLNQQSVSPFQKCRPIIRNSKKKEDQETRLKLCYTLDPSQCASPASAGSHCAGLKSIM